MGKTCQPSKWCANVPQTKYRYIEDNWSHTGMWLTMNNLNWFSSVRSVWWLREKCQHITSNMTKHCNTHGGLMTHEELWMSNKLARKVYAQAVWTETCKFPRFSFQNLSKLKKQNKKDSAVTFCSILQTGKIIWIILTSGEQRSSYNIKRLQFK